MKDYQEMKSLRETSNGETRVLYHLNYWDGPISGVCLLNGKRHYFDTVDEIHEEWTMTDDQWRQYCKENSDLGIETDPEERIQTDWYRVYGIFETPDEVMEIIEENHQLFTKYVGTHCDYDYGGKRPLHHSVEEHQKVLNKTDHDKFYGRTKRSATIDTKNWTVLSKFVYPF